MTVSDKIRDRRQFDVEIDGSIYSLPARCTHRGGFLCFGKVNPDQRTLTCPLHRAVFSLETGERRAGPDCPRLDVHRKQEHI